MDQAVEDQAPVAEATATRRLPRRALLIGGASAAALVGLLIPAVRLFTGDSASIDAKISYIAHAHHAQTSSQAATRHTASTSDAVARTPSVDSSATPSVVMVPSNIREKMTSPSMTHAGAAIHDDARHQPKHTAAAGKPMTPAAADDATADASDGGDDGAVREAAAAGFAPTPEMSEVRFAKSGLVPRDVASAAVITDMPTLVTALHAKSGEYCGMRSDPPLHWNFTGGYLLCVVREHGAVRSNLLRREPDGHFTFLGGTHGEFTRASLADYFAMPAATADHLLTVKPGHPQLSKHMQS